MIYDMLIRAFPVMYKRDDSGQILSSYGKEYYRDNVPFEGVYLDYFHKIWTHVSVLAGLRITFMIHGARVLTHRAAVPRPRKGMSKMLRLPIAQGRPIESTPLAGKKAHGRR